LELSVKKINDLVRVENIKYVIITGDITNSATVQQYQDLKNILDKLIIPYIPLMGNHDIWSYNSTWEEKFFFFF
jgi:3',5'-cyclic AMP phosphodiesterase CpdA